MIEARVVFVVSNAVPASQDIGKALLETGKFKEEHCDVPYDVQRYEDCLLIWEDQEFHSDEPIDWENYFKTDCFVILYRHSGRGGKDRLTVHPQGNFSKEPVCGKGRSIAYASPIYHRHMFKCIKNVAALHDTSYLVNYEVTHHGPTLLKTPVMFVEIGDTEKNWNDKDAHKMIAESVLMFVEKEPESATLCLGIGGEHYGERFERRTFTEGWAFGHMIPGRDFEHLDAELLQTVIDKNGGVELVVWDKKKQGTPEEREWILAYLEEKGLKVKKI